jgi:mannosyltransferase OCH1-like enzyme
MIRPLIHHVWLGPRALPAEWVARWQAGNPDWEQRVWREPEIRALLNPANARVFDAYLARCDYPGAADVARVEILHAVGGVYTDIDSEPLRPFAGAPWLAAGFVAAYTLPLRGHPGRVGNGTLAGVVGHPVLTDYREAIGRQARIFPAWDTTGGTLLTQVLARHRDDPTVQILPSSAFYPQGRNGERATDGGLSYVQHYWSSSPRPIRAYP